MYFCTVSYRLVAPLQVCVGILEMNSILVITPLFQDVFMKLVIHDTLGS